MRDDIYGALKNALERGEPIEQAIRSLVNAGYNDIEVKETANQMSPGVLSTVSQPHPSVSPSVRPSPRYRPLSSQQVRTTQHVKSSNKGKIIALLVILVILIGALTSIIIFRQQLVDFLTSLF